MRKLANNDDAPDLAPLVQQWSAITPPAAPAPSGSRCAVTYHHWYHSFRPADANRCLSEIAALGAGYLRADIRWKDLMPDGDRIDENALLWYRHYLSAARNWYGLRPVVVLSNPPRSVTNRGHEEIMASWLKYTSVVATQFGDLCQSYQLMNEINNPVFRFLPANRVTEGISRGAAVIRSKIPQSVLMVNILADLWGWEHELGTYAAELRSTVDIVGIDFYPGTWAIGFADHWSRTERALARLVESNVQLPRVAVLETGYSTNLPFLRGPRQQLEFYRRLESTLSAMDRQNGGRQLALIALYEICDENSAVLLDPEAHVGLLSSGSFRRKPAFAQAQKICGLFH